jgi:hypothetical protein
VEAGDRYRLALSTERDWIAMLGKSECIVIVTILGDIEAGSSIVSQKRGRRNWLANLYSSSVKDQKLQIPKRQFFKYQLFKRQFFGRGVWLQHGGRQERTSMH